ncbi:MAG TPA: hypothetical protein P5077_13535, partial [bacterium]|nr:hypothetical protein [bacterium]
VMVAALAGSVAGGAAVVALFALGSGATLWLGPWLLLRLGRGGRGEGDRGRCGVAGIAGRREQQQSQRENNGTGHGNLRRIFHRMAVSMPAVKIKE